MSEQDGRPPASRPRPVYGLPGSPSPGPAEGSAEAPRPFPPEPSAPQRSAWQGPPAPYSSQPAPYPSPSAPPPGTPGMPGPPRRGRGTVPLVLGLVLLLVIGPAALVIGLVLSVNHLVGDAVDGPTVMPGPTAAVEAPGSSMIILYVAQADAATAECTVEGEGVTVVPQSSTVEFGDGSTYHQVLGAVAQGDTTMTVSCTGVTAPPAYLGPYSVFGIAGPMLAGVGGGVLLGLVGLVLLIVGIVTKVRARRP